MVLSRLLTVSDFGYFGMIAAITGAAVLIGDFGLSSASMQARSISDQQRSNLFWVNSGIGLIAALLLFAFADPLANFYGQGGLVPLICALSAVFVLSSLTTQYYADAAREMKFKLLAVADVVAPITGLLVAILLAVSGAGVWSLVAQQLVTLSVRLLIVAVGTRWIPRLPARAPMRGLLTFGLSAFGVQALNYVSSSIDSVLIGRYLGPAQLGLYDRAYQLFKLPMQQIAAPLTRVALPVLARQQDDMGRLNSAIRRAHHLIILLIGAALTFLLAAGQAVIGVFLGAGWSGATPVLSILAVGGFFQMSGYAYYWAFLATGRTTLQLKFSVVTRVLMIALILVSVQFGLLGVAAGVSLGLVLNWLVLTIWPVRAIGIEIKPLLRESVRPMVAHIIAGTLTFLVGLWLVGFQLPPILILSAQALCALLSYALLAVLSRGLRRDFHVIYQFVRSSL
ncbi:lipopolysaccharide biosynthesis protein [Microbacterium saperdae]|nr:lipopolysaccharide biosynthesis protein [Microbacterium saperdae]